MTAGIAELIAGRIDATLAAGERRAVQALVARRTAVPSAWDSPASLFVVAETVIGKLTRQLGSEAARRIREVEGLRGL